MTSCMYREKYEINFRNTNGKRKLRNTRILSRTNSMSAKTKNFIQKICYKKTASIDMTRYGFINDSKLHPVNLLLRPLKAQLERICGKPSRNASGRKNTPVKKVKLELPESASSIRTSRQTFSPSSQSTPRSPNSAASSPGTRTPRRQPPRQSHQSRPPLRKITTPKPANPPHTYKKKRVTVVSATNKVKKNEVIVTRR